MSRRPAILACALALAACSGSNASRSGASEVEPAPLAGTAWKLVAWSGHEVPQPPRGQVPTIRFEADRVSGTLPCNGFSAGATVAGTTLTLGPMMSTKRACEALDDESALSQALAAPLTIERGADKLTLVTPDGVRLEFAPDAP